MTKHFLFSLTIAPIFNLQADILASWDFSQAGSVTDSAPFAFSATSPPVAGVQSATLSMPAADGGTALFFYDRAQGFAENGSYGFEGHAAQTALRARFLAGSYFHIAVDAEPGQALNLSSLDFNLNTSGHRPFDQLTLSALVRSTSGFSPVPNIFSGTGTNFQTSIMLNDPSYLGAFQEIDSVIFEVRGESTKSGFFEIPGNGELSFSNIGDMPGLQIRGAAVPEMSTALPLACILGVALIGYRRPRTSAPAARPQRPR